MFSSERAQNGPIVRDGSEELKTRSVAESVLTAADVWGKPGMLRTKGTNLENSDPAVHRWQGVSTDQESLKRAGGRRPSHSHCREFDTIRLVEIGFELHSVDETRS